MIDIRDSYRITLEEANDKIEKIIANEKSRYDDTELSRFLFKNSLTQTKKESIKAHLQAIHTQVNKILYDDRKDLKKDVLYFEFSKGITLFDKLTRVLELKNTISGDNIITSQDFFLDAINTYQNFTPKLYHGSLDFSYIPFKLRLAIEVYFKNMIGFSEVKAINKKQNKTSEFRLPISKILEFLSNENYSKYAKLPIGLDILKNINIWSNNLIHTGEISFPWQSLTAIDLLEPLFHIQHENGEISAEGFNYLNLDYSQEDLIKNLNTFLSNQSQTVEIKLQKRKTKPIEGQFYY